MSKQGAKQSVNVVKNVTVVELTILKTSTNRKRVNKN